MHWGAWTVANISVWGVAVWNTQRCEYPSREYPTELLGIHDVKYSGTMTVIPNQLARVSHK